MATLELAEHRLPFGCQEVEELLQMMSAGGGAGVSPTVEITTINGGKRITITDKDGPHTFDIMDGEDGQPGKDGKDGSPGADGKPGSDGQPGADGDDGISPTVEITEIAGGYQITITDVNGPKTAEILHGKEGAAGPAGQDGQNGQDGQDGQDGKPGAAGADGVGIESVTQTTTSAEDGGENIITVKLTNGKTSTFKVKNGSKGSSGNPGADGQPGQDGADGQPGADGKDGVGIKSVQQTTTSTADGGENVITVTLTDGTTATFKVNNGSKGSTGASGANGKDGSDATVTTESITGALGYTPAKQTDVDNLSGEIADLSLGMGEDGRLYLLRKGVAQGNGIELPSGASGDVIGNIGDGNIIMLSGDVPDGSYTLKFEMENGTVIDIGNMVLDSNVYYSITNNLTNCTNGNSATKAIEGNSYTATVTAKSGYKLSSVTVTMGGTNITSSAVSGGNISIANVTGNIVISAVAVEDKPAYTNLANPSSSDWWPNSRIGSDGTARTGVTGNHVTNPIHLTNGDVVRVEGLDLVNSISGGNSTYCGVYSKAGAIQSTALFTSQTNYFNAITATATGGQGTWKWSGGDGYIRFAGKPTGTVNDIVITVNEEI